MSKKPYLTLVSDNRHPVRTVTFARIEKLSGLFDTPVGSAFMKASQDLKAQTSHADRVIKDQETFLRNNTDSGKTGLSPE